MTKEEKPESAHCTDKAYRVEVRATRAPLFFDDRGYVAGEWRVLPEKSAEGIGCAMNSERDIMTRSHDYYGAVSLAASFLSHLPLLGRSGLEVRLIEYERSIDYTMKKLEVKPFPDEIDDIFERAGLSDRVRDSEDRGVLK